MKIEMELDKYEITTVQLMITSKIREAERECKLYKHDLSKKNLDEESRKVYEDKLSWSIHRIEQLNHILNEFNSNLKG